MIDQERIISGAIMKRRTSNTFVGCKKLKNTVVNKRTPLGLKQMNYFGTSIMNGSCVVEQFQRNAKTIENEIDWTIIQNVFNLNSTSDDDDDEEMLNGLQLVKVLRNESQTRISNRLSTRRSNQTQEPLRLRKENEIHKLIRSQEPLPELDDEENIIFPAPSPVFVHGETRKSIQIQKPLSARKEKEIRKSNRARDPDDEENIISAPPSPLYVLEDHDPCEDIQFNLPDADLITPPMDYRNNNCTDFLNGNTSVQNVPVDHSDSEDIDLGNVSQINDTITSLKEDSLELQILKKLIGLWKRNVHPINVDSILPTKCNRIQAARAFGSLLGM